MTTPTSDPLAALLELVRAAAREGTIQALAARGPATATVPPPLLDKKGLAHALGVSTATVDRLCRERRIPYVHVGDVRRFDLDAVRAALGSPHQNREPAPSSASDPAGRSAVPGDIRLLSRGGRR
jgi:excisionase family DNA binding protein